MSRNICLYGINVETPDHTRFQWREHEAGDWGWDFTLDDRNPWRLSKLAEEAVNDVEAYLGLESACCIAIVWWQHRQIQVEEPRTPGWIERGNYCIIQQNGWRQILTIMATREKKPDGGE